jgi:hypothetical protein
MLAKILFSVIKKSLRSTLQPVPLFSPIRKYIIYSETSSWKWVTFSFDHSLKPTLTIPDLNASLNFVILRYFYPGRDGNVVLATTSSAHFVIIKLHGFNKDQDWENEVQNW